MDSVFKKSSDIKFGYSLSTKQIDMPIFFKIILPFFKEKIFVDKTENLKTVYKTAFGKTFILKCYFNFPINKPPTINFNEGGYTSDSKRIYPFVSHLDDASEYIMPKQPVFYGFMIEPIFKPFNNSLND